MKRAALGVLRNVCGNINGFDQVTNVVGAMTATDRSALRELIKTSRFRVASISASVVTIPTAYLGYASYACNSTECFDLAVCYFLPSSVIAGIITLTMRSHDKDTLLALQIVDDQDAATLDALYAQRIRKKD